MEAIAKCPTCDKYTFESYIDESESFFQNVVPTSIALSILRSLRSSWEEIPSVERRLCKGCSQYGYVCSKCQTSIGLGGQPADGAVYTCVCRQRNMVRNPAHFLKWS